MFSTSTQPPQRWRTARRSLPLDSACVVGILNITPDSFSDGGRLSTVEGAVLAAQDVNCRRTVADDPAGSAMG